jgi:hypothetical protein
VISRALTTRPAVRIVMLLLLLVGVLGTGPATAVTAADGALVSVHVSAAASVPGDEGDDDTTRPTFNEFLPDARPLGDCLSSLPKPDCGSEARGGWRQTAVFLAIVAGLAFIAWRVVAASRRARRDRASVTSGTPAATTVPDGGDGDPAP